MRAESSRAESSHAQVIWKRIRNVDGGFIFSRYTAWSLGAAKTLSHPSPPRKTPISQPLSRSLSPFLCYSPIITRSSPITAMDPSSKHLPSSLPSSLPLSQRKSKTPPPPTGVGSSVYLPYPQKFSCRDERFYRLNSNFPDVTPDGTLNGDRESK
jgi:hypothetical protein